MKKITLLIIFILAYLYIYAEENYDWLLEHRWWLEDGRELIDPLADFVYWNTPPNVIFGNLEELSRSTLYQVRLRRERFYFLYQTDEESNRFFIIGSTYGIEPFDVEFRNNFSYMLLHRGRMIWGGYNRSGQQENNRYPLVGIWGRLPALNEYRLIDPTGCKYFMEIDKEIPGWAVRSGAYLLRQIGDNVFETVSSFPDGQLRLEIRNDGRILLLPLFSLPDDERGRIAPLVIRRRFTN